MGNGHNAKIVYILTTAPLKRMKMDAILVMRKIGQMHQDDESVIKIHKVQQRKNNFERGLK